MTSILEICPPVRSTRPSSHILRLVWHIFRTTTWEAATFVAYRTQLLQKALKLLVTLQNTIERRVCRFRTIKNGLIGKTTQKKTRQLIVTPPILKLYMPIAYRMVNYTTYFFTRATIQIRLLKGNVQNYSKWDQTNTKANMRI